MRVSVDVSGISGSMGCPSEYTGWPGRDNVRPLFGGRWASRVLRRPRADDDLAGKQVTLGNAFPTLLSPLGVFFAPTEENEFEARFAQADVRVVRLPKRRAEMPRALRVTV